MLRLRSPTPTFYVLLGIVLVQSAISQAVSIDVTDSSGATSKDKNDGIESENFMPVSHKQSPPVQSASEEGANISNEAEEEGSGSDQSMAFARDMTDVLEGSGDDGATRESISTEDRDNDSKESTNTTVPFAASDSSERGGKSYEAGDTETSSNGAISAIATESVQAKDIVPVALVPIESTVRPDTADNKLIDANVTHAGVARIGASKDSQATYVLLTCLGVILVLLIIYLIYKRYQSSSKHTHYINDAENAPKEMHNMNRHNIGKPLRKDEQCIHIPLIPDHERVVEKPNGLTASAEEPMLQKVSELPTENGHCEPDAVHLHTDRTPVPNGVHVDAPHSNGATTATVLHKSPRYSPVYSHDTGRIKIKLTETMRPKTPILVTRTKSNATETDTRLELTESNQKY